MNKLITSIFAVCLGLNVLSQAALSARDDNAFCYNDSCSSGFSVNAEWLYLRPCTDHHQFGSVVEESDDTECVRRKYLDPDLTSGFRIGLGYRETDCCNWDLGINWLHFCSDDSKKFKNPSFLIKVNNPVAKTKVKNEIDEVHLHLGYKFCVGECFSLRPHTALYYLNYCRRMEQISLLDEADEFFELVRENRDFEGIGPQFGFNAEWDFYCGMGVYGNVALSLVYGDVDLKQKTQNNNNSPSIVFKKDSFDCSSAVLECGLGIYYRSETCGYPYNLVLGWEHHHYTDVGFFRERDLGSDFSLQGLRLGLGVGF